MAAVPSTGRASRVEAPLAPEANATRDLYERYAGQIFRYCLHQLGSREEAEDAVQSTFLNAFRGIKRGVVPEAESAWLFKIAENVCLSRRRSTWRRGRIESPADFEVVEELAPAPTRRGDELIGLQDVLEQMPENQRRAILLREWQGLSYREIADELELSQSAVETLIFRARRSLAEGLEQPPDSRRKVRRGADFGNVLAGLKSLLVGGSAAAKVAATVAVVSATTVAATAPVQHRTPRPDSQPGAQTSATATSSASSGASASSSPQPSSGGTAPATRTQATKGHAARRGTNRPLRTGVWGGSGVLPIVDASVDPAAPVSSAPSAPAAPVQAAPTQAAPTQTLPAQPASNPAAPATPAAAASSAPAVSSPAPATKGSDGGSASSDSPASPSHASASGPDSSPSSSSAASAGSGGGSDKGSGDSSHGASSPSTSSTSGSTQSGDGDSTTSGVVHPKTSGGSPPTLVTTSDNGTQTQSSTAPGLAKKLQDQTIPTGGSGSSGGGGAASGDDSGSNGDHTIVTIKPASQPAASGSGDSSSGSTSSGSTSSGSTTSSSATTTSTTPTTTTSSTTTTTSTTSTTTTTTTPTTTSPTSTTPSTSTSTWPKVSTKFKTSGGGTSSSGGSDG